MRLWSVYKRSVSTLSFLVLLSACAERDYLSTRTVNVIQAIPGESCGYQVAPVTLQTLDSLAEMRGRVGRVVTTKKDIDSEPNILNLGESLLPIDTQFSLEGGTAFPVDMPSLFSASLYYAIESSYLMFRNLEPKADLALVVPNFADTTIVYNTKAKDGSSKKLPEIYDNAEFLAHRANPNSKEMVRNYFFAYPNKDVKDIPLGLNMGVLSHEYSHMVFHHLFLEPGIQRDTRVSDRSGTRPTQQTVAALDEGLADYFGFLATKDPGFLLCSFPYENRNLAVAKEFTEDVVLRLERDPKLVDPHEAGAVFAAIQYRIGEELKSHETNAITLIRMMSQMLECPDIRVDSQTLGFDFGDLAKCHLRQYVDGAQQATVRGVYERYLGIRYRGR